MAQLVYYMLNAKNCLNCKRLQILQPIFSAWNFTINWTFYFIYMIKSASWCWPMLIKSGEMKDRYFMYWSSLLLIGLPINKARGSHQVWRVLNILHNLSWRFMSMQWPDPLPTPSLVLQPTCFWKSDRSLWIPVDPVSPSINVALREQFDTSLAQAEIILNSIGDNSWQGGFQLDPKTPLVFFEAHGL